jgi:SAM-dependent methyltransferase
MTHSVVSHFLANPLTRGLSIDDPRTTELRRRIIREKSFLRQIYLEWYRSIATAIPPGSEPVLELGSGGGFLDEIIPRLITSEIFSCAGIKLVLDGQSLPFADASLRAVVMTDVLHHIPQPGMFLAEAARVIRPGGAVVAIEPWVTPWSRWVHNRFHYERFDPDDPRWDFDLTGPLSGANGAIPWIIFNRDRARFEKQFPQWQIKSIEPGMPLRYVLSGGVRLRSLMPGFTFGLWRGVESLLHPFRNSLAMFARIVLVRR